MFVMIAKSCADYIAAVKSSVKQQSASSNSLSIAKAMPCAVFICISLFYESLTAGLGSNPGFKSRLQS
ncbi:hypothetical protein SCG7109_AE_00290 [Chlamydiales bacterium SCGC AG-110-M15]|nr:hypothetical protein SCG7109_AE_00290 [Chlamydiales bacterium SCGC AG-110-M15]